MLHPAPPSDPFSTTQLVDDFPSQSLDTAASATPSPLCPVASYPVSMPIVPIKPAAIVVLLPVNVVPFITPSTT